MALEKPTFKENPLAYNLKVNLPKERNLDLNKKESTIQGISKGFNNIPVDNNINTPKIDIDVDEATENIESEFGKKAVGAGISALGELPGIINNFTTTPENEQAAMGKVMSMASSGAKIGSSFGPWGALAGAGVGAIAGVFDNKGWQQKLIEKNDDEAIEKNKDAIVERQQNYYLNKTAEQIKAEKNVFAEAQGIYTS